MNREWEKTLETERLLLRPWREEDAEALYTYAKDPGIGPACGWKPHRSAEESREIIRKVLAVPGTYAVTDRKSGEPIGSIGIFPSRADGAEAGDMEIGFWIGKPYWGQGLIPEAVFALLEHCFTVTNCQRIWCGYFDGNRKSKRVQEKCGFAYHHTRPNFFWEPTGEIKTEHFTVMSRERWGSRGYH